jgi:hypothetical protein
MNCKREKMFSLILVGVVVAAANTAVLLGGGLIQFAKAQQYPSADELRAQVDSSFQTKIVSYCFESERHEICQSTLERCEQGRIDYTRYYERYNEVVEITPCEPRTVTETIR